MIAPVTLGLVSSSLVLSPGRAVAQQPAPDAAAIERADAAFEEGREFFDQGRFREACEKFELSMQLDPSPGTLLNLGNCYEPQGDLVRALTTFERAFVDAQKAPDPRRKELWTEAARERIANLSRRVPQLSVRGVPDDGRVSIDQRPIDTEGGATRINPGNHTLEVSAPGKQAFVREFEITVGQKLAINVPPLEDELGPAATPTASAGSTEPTQTVDGVSTKYGPWPYVIGGAGVVLLGTSLITGLSASSKKSELEDKCNGTVCDPSPQGTADSAKTLALLTDVFWVTGLVATGIGVTLFVLDQDSAPSTNVQAGCFESGCGLRATGHF